MGCILTIILILLIFTTALVIAIYRGARYLRHEAYITNGITVRHVVKSTRFVSFLVYGLLLSLFIWAILLAILLMTIYGGSFGVLVRTISTSIGIGILIEVWAVMLSDNYSLLKPRGPGLIWRDLKSIVNLKTWFVTKKKCLFLTRTINRVMDTDLKRIFNL